MNFELPTNISRDFTTVVKKIASYIQVMPNVNLHQSLTLPTVQNVTVPKNLHFFLFQFFASSWFKSPAICCNYSTELHHHRWEKIFIRLQSQDFSDEEISELCSTNICSPRYGDITNATITCSVTTPSSGQIPDPGVGCTENKAGFGT